MSRDLLQGSIDSEADALPVGFAERGRHMMIAQMCAKGGSVTNIMVNATSAPLP